MPLQAFTFNPFQENTYLIYDSGGAAILIDPGMHAPQERLALQTFIEEQGLFLTQVLLTHAHIDHILGVRWAVEKWDVPLYYHEREAETLAHAPMWAEMLGIPYQPVPPCAGYLQEGQTFCVGNMAWEVIHTPGHAPGHVIFWCASTGDAIVGDLIFAGSIGNYHLPGADYETLMQSLFQKLLPLGDHVRLWPGHGPQTSIFQEKTANPFLVSFPRP
ncbi:MAG: MBL fold metallo-hydrolase [Bacteroidia bacterium]